MDLVGLAHTPEAAVSLYSKTRPDLTLVDLDLPMAGGIERIQTLRALDPSALIVGLAVYELDTCGAKALAAGAAAIVAKDQAAETLPHLIRALVHG
jgi:DNA-binding NarL/FixJ family response regulator